MHRCFAMAQSALFLISDDWENNFFCDSSMVDLVICPTSWRGNPWEGSSEGQAVARPMVASAVATALVTHGSAAVLLLVLAAAPLLLWLPGYQINIVTQILIYAVMATGLNVMVGFAGLIWLGHAAFFSVAAYTTAILLASAYSHTVSVSAAPALTILTTAACAVLSLNSSGIGFQMITLTFGGWSGGSLIAGSA